MGEEDSGRHLQARGVGGRGPRSVPGDLPQGLPRPRNLQEGGPLLLLALPDRAQPLPGPGASSEGKDAGEPRRAGGGRRIAPRSPAERARPPAEARGAPEGGGRGGGAARGAARGDRAQGVPRAHVPRDRAGPRRPAVDGEDTALPWARAAPAEARTSGPPGAGAPARPHALRDQERRPWNAAFFVTRGWTCSTGRLTPSRARAWRSIWRPAPRAARRWRPCASCPGSSPRGRVPPGCGT